MNDSLLQLQALLPTALRHMPRLGQMSLRQHDLPPRAILYSVGEVPTRIYFVAKGWVSGSLALSTSIRPFCAVSMRGDVIGLKHLNGRKAQQDMQTLTFTELISVPVDEYRECMASEPELAEFTCAELVRQLSYLEVMNAVIGRMTAPDRLAFFLYILMQRSRRIFQGSRNVLSLPLTQEEIGRQLGLTNVSVNRAFRKLESESLITTGRQTVTFVDEARFTDRLQLDDRVDLIDQLTAR